MHREHHPGRTLGLHLTPLPALRSRPASCPLPAAVLNLRTECVRLRNRDRADESFNARAIRAPRHPQALQSRDERTFCDELLNEPWADTTRTQACGLTGRLLWTAFARGSLITFLSRRSVTTSSSVWSAPTTPVTRAAVNRQVAREPPPWSFPQGRASSPDLFRSAFGTSKAEAL